MLSGIYILLAPSGGLYIGSTVNFDKRFKRHMYELKSKKHHCAALQRAYDKYQGNLQYLIIEHCEKIQLTEREQWWMNIYQTITKNIYNSSMIAGRIEMTPERRLKIGQAHRGMKRSVETRLKMREAAVLKNPELANKPYDPTRPTRKPRWQVDRTGDRITARKYVRSGVRKTIAEKRNAL